MFIKIPRSNTHIVFLTYLIGLCLIKNTHVVWSCNINFKLLKWDGSTISSWSSRIYKAVKFCAVTAWRFAPWNKSSFIIILYSKKHSNELSSSPSSLNYSIYAQSLMTPIWSGVRPSLSAEFKSAFCLIRSSTFLSSLWITAKWSGVAYIADFIFTS